MDSKTYGIGILTLTATALLIANMFAPARSVGQAVIANDDMQAVTARSLQGGDALYLLDNSSGKLAVFTVDARKGLQLQTVQNIEEGFQASGGGGGGGGRK
jgi:hypothetical protein